MSADPHHRSPPATAVRPAFREPGIARDILRRGLTKVRECLDR